MDWKRQTRERCGRGFAFAMIDNKHEHHKPEKHTRGEGMGLKSTSKVSCGGLYIAILQLNSSADTAAQRILARIGPGSATQNGDEHLRDSGPDEGGIRAAESGGIRQMGADRVQLDPVTSRMFRTAPYGLMASPRLIGCILAGYMRSKEKDGGD